MEDPKSLAKAMMAIGEIYERVKESNEAERLAREYLRSQGINPEGIVEAIGEILRVDITQLGINIGGQKEDGLAHSYLFIGSADRKEEIMRIMAPGPKTRITIFRKS